MPELTDPQVRKAKPTAKPVKLYDERGLYLEVRPSGSKWWRLKYRFEGKEKLLSLGTYPDTGLKEARENRDKERKLLAAGIDPSAARQEAQATKKAAHANSFEAVAREWHTTIHKHKNSEQHADHTLRRFETDIFPYIGAERIDKITPPMLLKTIQRIEARGAIETPIECCRHAGRCSAMPSLPGARKATRRGICGTRCGRRSSGTCRQSQSPSASESSCGRFTDIRAR